MALCNCAGGSCGCRIISGPGVEVNGNGTSRNPYILERLGAAGLVGGVTSGATVTVTGTGAVGDPYVVSITTEGGSTSTMTVYENSDTWVKPPAGSIAHVTVIGGGGGGGAASADTNFSGGGGGSGGALSIAWFPLADLPASCEVRVGEGGLGAVQSAGVTTGGQGGRSWFGDFLYAAGGHGGSSQAGAAPPAQPEVVPGTPGPDGGDSGGAGATRDGTTAREATAHYDSQAPTGGGLGAGNEVSASSGGMMPMGSFWAGRGGNGGVAGEAPVTPGQNGEYYGGGGGGGGVKEYPMVVPFGFEGFTGGGDGAPGVVVVTVW